MPQVGGSFDEVTGQGSTPPSSMTPENSMWAGWWFVAQLAKLQASCSVLLSRSSHSDKLLLLLLREQGKFCDHLDNTPGIIFVKVDGNFTLTCTYNSCRNLKVQINWCKQLTTTNCPEIHENINRLAYTTTENATITTKVIVGNASKEDSGRYRCQAKRPSIQMPFAIGHIIRVVVVAPSEFAVSISKSTVWVTEGDSVNLTCVITFPADHLGNLVISWMMGNISCDKEDPAGRNKSTIMLGEKGQNQSVLSVHGVRKSSFYTCCVSAEGLTILREGASGMVYVITAKSSNGIILPFFGPILLCKFLFLVLLLALVSESFRQKSPPELKTNLKC
ncbi:uncharacterized protein LOC115097615 [Rhinatrema bivittatum]|uniref:uncharacterized protein LOC115097615 n=1 Tax=Rhinatrema bivittatum TaxID=194408 RepID=UPI00112EE790|nr:uncharacterized protein LOC115097615 [Rhinatrema bivittatum]